jgi:hypothetical protein
MEVVALSAARPVWYFNGTINRVAPATVSAARTAPAQVYPVIGLVQKSLSD